MIRKVVVKRLRVSIESNFTCSINRYIKITIELIKWYKP